MVVQSEVCDDPNKVSNNGQVWWGRLDLNQRPISYEPTALTTELRPRKLSSI
ncbi:MAG: hypothetical protein JWO35_215 [Candidatus Saccharibacteria bacterium]|nr:hypothetical protein [Candidatus Saccharibacteria bacterium]